MIKCEGDSGQLPTVLIARYMPAGTFFPRFARRRHGGRNFDRVTYSIAKQPHVHKRMPWSPRRRKTSVGILLTEMVQDVSQLAILISCL